MNTNHLILLFFIISIVYASTTHSMDTDHPEHTQEYLISLEKVVKQQPLWQINRRLKRMEVGLLCMSSYLAARLFLDIRNMVLATRKQKAVLKKETIIPPAASTSTKHQTLV